eukprot:5749885-Pyramimonas_sp.AAC.1
MAARGGTSPKVPITAGRANHARGPAPELTARLTAAAGLETARDAPMEQRGAQRRARAPDDPSRP